MLALQRVLSTLALVAVALWLGGLIALGAVAAPVVFSMVAFPSNADAMTVVFRRFDLLAMGSAAIVLATEAARMRQRMPFDTVDRVRAIASLLAAGCAVYEGVKISPRIAALHAAGAIRGVGAPGIELAELHDVAEACGKAAAVLLAAIIALHVVALSRPRFREAQHLHLPPAAREGREGDEKTQPGASGADKGPTPSSTAVDDPGTRT